jgi:hypothetical protein
MSVTVLFAVAAALAACGGSSSKTTTTPAASAAASTKSPAATPGATKASASPSAAAPTSSSAGGDTCTYLSPSDASALLANPGAAKVTNADTPATKQTTCSWGAGATNRIILVVNDIKVSAALSAIRGKMDTDVIEKIAGLGDAGGFQTKDADAVSVLFVKGSKQVLLSVAATGVNADAVVAAAKKIAAGL